MEWAKTEAGAGGWWWQGPGLPSTLGLPCRHAIPSLLHRTPPLSLTWPCSPIQLKGGGAGEWGQVQIRILGHTDHPLPRKPVQVLLGGGEAESAGWRAGICHSLCSHWPNRAGACASFRGLPRPCPTQNWVTRDREQWGHSGALWSPNSQDNGAVVTKGRWDAGDSRNPNSSMALRRATPFILQFSISASRIFIEHLLCAGGPPKWCQG